MELTNQTEAMQKLQNFADQRKQAILLCGASGVGKTYLAKEYSKLLDIPDFNVIEAKVDAVKSAIDSATILENKIVLCIENLDLGVPAVSYAMLKFLEEPKSNVFLVITCRNINQIPDTIISRVMMLSIPNLTESDIELYAKTKDSPMIQQLQSDKTLWKCVKNFNDLDTLLNLSDKHIGYFKEIIGSISPNNSVSNIVWKIQKFPDSTAVPIEIAIRYLMYSNPIWQTLCLQALNDLALNRLSAHAVLSKLVFGLKAVSMFGG